MEKISTESAPAPKKSKPSRKSSAKATPSTSTSQPQASSSRPSDPQHSEEQLVFPETAVTASSPLKGVVDVHAKMYNLPSLAVLYELLVYLHTSYNMQLRPVSTCFLFIFLQTLHSCIFLYGFTSHQYLSRWGHSQESTGP